MDLNWSDLRALNGSQSAGFEELCSQLARLEAPAGAGFVRKGSPDGGVECFWRLNDGREWCWQAKFFREALGNSQWNQLDRSVKAALDAHPRLVRYVVCVPHDPADSRRPDVTTEMQRWDSRVAKWEAWAAERGMAVEFVWWGSSELISRLSQDDQAGRVRFWFQGAGRFSDEWFDKHLQRAIKAAGPRYTPEIHVDVPLIRDFELFGRSELAVETVRRLAKGIKQTPIAALRRHVGDDAVDAMAMLAGVDESIARVTEAVLGMSCHPDEEWRLSGIVSDIEDALGHLDTCEAPLTAAADAHDERSKTDEPSWRHRPNPYGDAVSDVDDLRRALWRTADTLDSLERVVNRDVMIVTGDAGTGKTHLFCDIARRRLADGRPTMVLMGHQFTTTESPWIQIRAQLDLLDVSAEQFVGALEAAAQAAGCRALFMIDAINEGEGHRIWRHHLSDLLAYISASRWIGVVLSVRTTYIDYIIPDEVRESAHILKHHGFADDTYVAMERFCEHYGLNLPTTPLLQPEFDNPLFLKTLCVGLSHTRLQQIPAGSEGISAVFGRFISAIDKTLASELDYDPQGDVVPRALDAVAAALANMATRWLPRSQAKDLVDSFVSSNGFSRSLYRALVDNGLLMESLDISSSELMVQFGYEWFADYLIAEHIIGSCGDADSVARALAGDDPSHTECTWEVWNAPLEPLAVLLPERFGVELPEVVTGTHYAATRIDQAFLAGLARRNPATIRPVCRELIRELLKSTRHTGIVEVFDAVVACALLPGHPLGSALLDQHLRRLEMPDRDATWSKYLYFAYGHSGPMDRLLDWAEKHPQRLPALDAETAAAWATVLAWCLTASHRFVRDHATKALVALLSDRVALTVELVERFAEVDDPYVVERVMAAAYGVAMRSDDPQALAPLAEAVYRLIFVNGEPPTHILLRDYARGIIERALHVGADIDIDAGLVEPPYLSTWPRIPPVEELKQFDPLKQDDRTSEPSDAERAQARISFSVMRWDFARYIIGTNSRSESNEWLSITNEEPLWQSSDELADSFRESLDPHLQPIFDHLWSETRTVLREFPIGRSDIGSNTAATGAPSISYPTQEPHIDSRFEEVFVTLLSEDQETAYEAVKAARGTSEPRLALDIIQRYIVWRVFDLGWTADRFGDLDSLIDRSASFAGTARRDRKPERMGKKYQWIAYHEILAHISDRYQYRSRYEDDVPKNAYKGTWQLSVRDIDPSTMVTATPSDHGRSENSETWWRHHAPITSVEDVSHEDWLQTDHDIPDRVQQLCFTNPKDSSTWIKLQGIDIWELPAAPDYDLDETARRETWLDAYGYLIRAVDVDEFIAWSKTVDFWNHWMPDPPRAGSLYFGELGWSFAFNALVGDLLEGRRPTPDEGAPCPVPLQPAALEYLTEGGYDCSLAEGYTLYRPNFRLVEAMNMRWTGQGAEFVDFHGTLITFDPSARDTSPAALLVREENLARHLDETGSALVWAILGGKRAMDPADSVRAWAGRLRLTGAAVYRPDGPSGHFTTQLEI